jgi:hypothetical protein
MLGGLDLYALVDVHDLHGSILGMHSRESCGSLTLS